MRIRIKKGRVLDPQRSVDRIADVCLADKKIVAVTAPDAAGPDGFHADRELDAAGCIVSPGLIDMHVHLREPGHEYKETIESGLRAAAAGGFTAVCCMPNTDPVNDNAQITRYIVERADSLGMVRVFPVGAISRGLEGKQMAEIGEMKKAGIRAVSDDGRPVADSLLMRRALEYAAGAGLMVISHCEDPHLSFGAMNEGALSTRLGLAGIPNASESIMVMRDIALAALTGCPVHIAHVSTAESVAAIRAGRERGVAVTAESAPHYFTLTDKAVAAYDTHAKMNPPLRSEADREAVRRAIADKTIGVIATDHAPHASTDKDVEFEMAANGIIGLETALPLALSLVKDGVIDIFRMIDAMAVEPGRIIGVPRTLDAGAPADITVIDPDAEYVYYAAGGKSKSRNTPFDGWKMKGCAAWTIVDGTIVYDRLKNV